MWDHIPLSPDSASLFEAHAVLWLYKSRVFSWYFKAIHPSLQWLISFIWPEESPRAPLTAMVLSSLCWRPDSVGNLGNLFPDIRRVLHRFYGSIWGWILQDKGLPQRLSSKESTCNAGDAGSITGWGRSPGGGHGCTGNPVQYSCLGNPMHRRALRDTVHGVSKSWTQLKQLSTHWDKYSFYNSRNHWF